MQKNKEAYNEKNIILKGKNMKEELVLIREENTKEKKLQGYNKKHDMKITFVFQSDAPNSCTEQIITKILKNSFIKRTVQEVEGKTA